VATQSIEELSKGVETRNDSTHIVKAISPVNVRSKPLPASDTPITADTILAYVPQVLSREWILSELDVEWIATGCYILGCGGGGAPYCQSLAIREMLRQGAKIRVIDLEDMEEGGKLIWGGGIGSPEVSQERLVSDDYNQAVSGLLAFMNVSFDHVET
jgi:hypothetical protein